jgi:hypothetical protein
VPLEEKAKEEELMGWLAPVESGPAEFTEIWVKEGLPPFDELESWKKLLKEEPVPALPWLVTVPEKVTAVPAVAEVGPLIEAVRSGKVGQAAGAVAETGGSD